MKRFFTFAFILVLLTGLTGCGEEVNFLTGGTEAEKQTVVSNEIYIPIEKIRTLNPVITKDEDAYFINKLIYESLFSFDEHLAVNNLLAESYQYLDDGLSLSIQLKKGIEWQDGHALTGEDVKFSIESYLNAAAFGETLYKKNVSNIKGVKVDSQNPLSVTISYHNKDNVSIRNLTFPIIPKHKFANPGAVKSQSANFMPVGTGPYKVSEYNDLTHFTLVGNEDYHGKNVPKNKLIFEILPNKKDAINLMAVNNLALTILKDIDRDTIYANKDLVSASFLSNQVEVLGFNYQKSLLKDRRVRQAISSVIDVKEILEIGYFNNGVLNDSIYFPEYLGTQSTIASPDIEKARKLLVEAGFIDRDGNGIAENNFKEELSINILVNEEDLSRVAAAQIIKNSLDKLPIRSTIVYKDWEGYNTDLAAGNFDLYIGGFQLNETYDLRPFLHSGYGNLLGYSNQSLDTLLDKMESGLSQEEMKATFTQIQTLLKEEVPYCTLLYKTYGAVASPGLKGGINPYFHHIYNGSHNWRYEYEVEKKN